MNENTTKKVPVVASYRTTTTGFPRPGPCGSTWQKDSIEHVRRAHFGSRGTNDHQWSPLDCKRDSSANGAAPAAGVHAGDPQLEARNCGVHTTCDALNISLRVAEPWHGINKAYPDDGLRDGMTKAISWNPESACPSAPSHRDSAPRFARRGGGDRWDEYREFRETLRDRVDQAAPRQEMEAIRADKFHDEPGRWRRRVDVLQPGRHRPAWAARGGRRPARA